MFEEKYVYFVCSDLHYVAAFHLGKNADFYSLINLVTPRTLKTVLITHKWVSINMLGRW